MFIVHGAERSAKLHRSGMVCGCAEHCPSSRKVLSCRSYGACSASGDRFYKHGAPKGAWLETANGQSGPEGLPNQPERGCPSRSAHDRQTRAGLYLAPLRNRTCCGWDSRAPCVSWDVIRISAAESALAYSALQGFCLPHSSIAFAHSSGDTSRWCVATPQRWPKGSTNFP